jgi:hypothetical protein
VTQAVECLLCKHKALSSNPNPTKRRRRRRRKKKKKKSIFLTNRQLRLEFIDVLQKSITGCPTVRATETLGEGEFSGVQGPPYWDTPFIHMCL